MNTKEKIAIMQAHIDGATVQVRRTSKSGRVSMWEDTFPHSQVELIWDWVGSEYRIKPRLVERWAIEDSQGNFYTTVADREDAAGYVQRFRAAHKGINPCKSRIYLLREVTP